MKTELLSPAGDKEAGYAAFYYGADAIYLGLRQFSARAEATNFSPEELDEITAYAHANHKKVYITVNTLLHESELNDLMTTLGVCDSAHVDGVIVQDLGVARVIHHAFPNLALHASTQMAIHNLSGALAMKKMGFKRVVLARELTLSEIQKIQQESGLEVEVFIHGALCYSYSGLCLFSAMTTGRSANRGRCVYSCRDTFQLNGRQYHPFSMKDLALEKEACKLQGLSLKIEGRKKNALYVAAVTDYYRRILDTGKADARLSDNLKQIFARPWTKLHFNGKNKAVIDPDFVGHRGLEIGRIEGILNHEITIKPNRAIARYDGIQIDVAGQEKPFGFSAENLSVNHKKVYEVPAGQTVKIMLPPHHPFIKKGDVVYLASSTQVKGAYPYTKPRPNEYKNREKIDVDVYLDSDKITACCREKVAEISGEFSAAQNPEKVIEAVQNAFQKTGDTAFELNEIHVDNPKSVFVPASVLNELRRQLYAAVKPTVIGHQLPTTPLIKSGNKQPIWVVKTDDLALAKSVKGYDELIYVLSSTDTPEDLNALPADKVRLALPTIMRPDTVWQKQVDRFTSAGFNKWEIGNPAGLTLLPKKADFTIDYTISVMNTQAVQQALELGAKRMTISPECSVEEIDELAKKSNQLTVVMYQDIPLFLSANCVRENDCRDCPKGRVEMPLKNAKGKYILISENCQTVVIAEKATQLPLKVRQLPVSALRIDFCYRKYTPEQASGIIDKIKNA